MKLKNSNSDKTPKIKLRQNSKTQIVGGKKSKNQIVTKLKKNEIVNKLKKI